MAANKPGKEAILAAFFDEGNYSPLFTDGAVSAAFGCANGQSVYAVYQNGVTRLVTTYGVGTDSLSSHGTVSFYYAGYVLNNASLNTGDMFATNSKDVAAAAGWNLTDESVFEVKTLKLDDKDIVPGLRRGLAGVKEGQECFILFSGKYGFGKHELGTIPANAALAYHIKVESISN